MARETDALTPRQQLAEQAWEVHRLMMLTEVKNPSLKDNPLWRLHRDDAFEEYVKCLERC